MLKTNKDNLVSLAVQTQPGQPRMRDGWRVDRDGVPFILPSIGGITLNLQVGDPAFGIVGDHIEPDVSCSSNPTKPMEFPNPTLQILSCAGNEAEIISGDMKGHKGTVIGQHGGSEHVVVHFSKEVKEKLSYDDKIMIKTIGQGLKILDFPNVYVVNLSPALLDKMQIKTVNGKLEVPVTTLVPNNCMGSGIGAASTANGDYDITTGDPESIKKYKLDKIRFGDFVALIDHDNRYGRDFRKGYISIGIVIHSDCLLAGHGPGVVTVMSGTSDEITTVINPKANIADILNIGTTL